MLRRARRGERDFCKRANGIIDCVHSSPTYAAGDQAASRRVLPGSRSDPFPPLDLFSGVFGARNSVFLPETGGPVIGSEGGGDWDRGLGDRLVPLVEEV